MLFPLSLFPDRLLSSGALGRHQLNETREAIADTRQAIDLYLGLVEGGAFSFRSELSRCFANLSGFLASVAEAEEACCAAKRAVALARLTVEAEPDRATPDLAFALETFATQLRALGRPAAALSTSEEALLLYEDVTKRGLFAHARRYAAALNNHAVYLEEAKVDSDLLALSRRAVEMLEGLEQETPGAAHEDLASAYVTYANALLREGSAAEATKALRNAVVILDAAKGPGSALRTAAAVSNLATALEMAGDATGARNARKEAIYRLSKLSPAEAMAIPGVAEAIRAQCR